MLLHILEHVVYGQDITLKLRALLWCGVASTGVSGWDREEDNSTGKFREPRCLGVGGIVSIYILKLPVIKTRVVLECAT